ncbi:nSTAND1 domain-containing NTPase [Anabaena sp. CA = ATCC 33047]|uniref:nSTAND1 domain-containing NTPase n=1 Tax=Anabaena sp. (strain CA / ATCC 33047) TaxID=52271 RepID=UPI00082CCB95|nr:caspase family protein [Anabaena sp. CA = ATCC 33047]
MSKHKFNLNFAIIIGINNYQSGIKELETAVPDAIKLAEILQKQHDALKPQYQAQNKYEVQLFLNQRAGLKQLNQLIADFKQGQIPLDRGKVTVTENDRLLFYFAGHGIALDALENQEGPVGYLIPQDAISGDSSTYLPMQELHDALNSLPCRHMLAILDCCFAGVFRWASLKREIVPKVKVYKERYDRFISDRAWQVITSAADDQTALDSLGSRGMVTEGNEVHSPFAKALFDGLFGKGADLNKDGIITATELYLYLRDQVEILTENNYKRQTPGLCPLKKHDKGEFIFLSSEFDRNNLEDAPPLNLENNPYRGLESYDEKHSHLFFGREEQIKKLYQKVVANNQKLTLVLGASGTGKSSLVKAGLIPKLRKDKTWFILPPFRPGESPFKSLNNALESVKQPLIAASSTTTPSRLLTPAEESLANWFNNHPQAKLLVVIDQFEELITLCKSDKEREQFEQLIKNAITKYADKIHVVITLRLDFEAQLQNSVLEKFWNDETRFVVPPMSQNEFREVIEKPALEKVIYFDPPSLVDDLINEVVQMPGALPLLSFTLSELYLKYLQERRDNRALTKEDYEQLGRVVGSLTKRANQEYDHLIQENPAYENTVQQVMLRMISLQGRESARRQVPKSELVYANEEENKRVQRIIKCFSEARLIVEGSNSQGEPYVEPAHDALVQGWVKLQEWIKQEQQNLPLQRRLTLAVLEWKTKKQSQDRQEAKFLWNADPYLDVLNKILNSSDNWLNQVETEFVKCSTNLREKNRRIRMGLVATAFSFISIFSFIQWKQNQEAQSINLSVSSKTLFAADQQIEALVEAIKSGKKLKSVVIPEASTTHQVVTTLYQLVYSSIEYNRLQEEKGFYRASFSPDGKMLVSVSQDNIIQLWSLDGKKLKKNFTSNLSSVDSINFSPNGKMLALAGNNDNFIEFWNLDGEDKPRTLKGKLSKTNSVSFSPDGTMLALGSNDGIIQLWNLDSNEVKTFTTNLKINSVSFSPDGTMLALGSNDGIIQLWDFRSNEIKNFNSKYKIKNVSFSPDGTMLASVSTGIIQLWSIQTGEKIGAGRELVGDVDWVSRVSFSQDGKMLASGGYNGIIKIWDTETGKELLSIQGSRGRTGASIMDITFSPNGKMLASVDDDKFIKLWNLNGENKSKMLKGQLSKIRNISFSPNGKMLALAGDDKFIELWNLDGQDKPRKLQLQVSKIRSIGFSPNGKMLALAGDDKFIELRNLDEQYEQYQPGKLLGHKSRVNSISFSPDGKMLASASDDQTIKLWSLDRNKEPTTLKGHSNLVNFVSFSPDGNFLASSSKDHTIKLWRLKDNKEVWSKKIGSGSGGQTWWVGFSPDSTILASVGSYNFIQLWNLDGNEFRRLRGNLSNINSVAFSPDSKMLASVETTEDSVGKAEESVIKFLNLEGLEFNRLKSQFVDINTISFSPDGKLLAVGVEDGTVILHNLDLDNLLRRGCHWIRDYLRNNPNVSEVDRHLCDDVPPITTNPEN